MNQRLEPEVRRRMIAEAVLAIAAREGLDRASVRDVAKEAGVSAGMVQHHFRTRDQMLQFACEYMVKRTNEHIGEQVRALPEPRGVRSILKTVFEEMLPLDEERRVGIRVWMAFLARAVVDPDMEAYMRGTFRNSQRHFTGLLVEARDRGELAPGVDPDRAATSLFALVDGLVSHVLIGHYTGDEALRAIDDALERVFASTPGR